MDSRGHLMYFFVIHSLFALGNIIQNITWQDFVNLIILLWKKHTSLVILKV